MDRKIPIRRQLCHVTILQDYQRKFEAKREVLRCYEDEYERTGHLWEKFIQAQGQLFGLQAGCEMAEGFEVAKFLY